jgi:hypothetical protein
MHHFMLLLCCRGVRPAPPEGAPDLPLVFQMLDDRLQLFRDLGGGSLHRCAAEYAYGTSSESLSASKSYVFTLAVNL